MSPSEEELDFSVPFQRRKSLLHYLIRIVVEHISKFSSQHEHEIDLFGSLEYILEFEYDDTIRNNFKTFVSLVQKLKVFFTVPNQQIMSHVSLNLNSNQVVAAFINFLLQMVEVILYFEADSIARVKGSIQNLRTELGFLIIFLGDTTMHLQPNKNIVIDIEAIVNEVGRFFYLFFVTLFLFVIAMETGTGNIAITDFEAVVNEVGSLLHKNFFDLIEDIALQTTEEEEGNEKNGQRLEVTNKAMTGIKALVHEVASFSQPSVFTGNDQVPESGKLDLALSNFLTKFQLLKTKIEEHCIAVSKMPSDMAPKTAVVSLFIVDSVLDDLMDLINNNSDKIIGVEGQIVTLHKELRSLGSSVADIAVQQEAEHEELKIQTRDIAYEVEYVINSFPHVWYLTIRLPQLIEKIQLIATAITEIKNNDAAGMPEVAKYPDEQVSWQSKKSPALEDNIVGFKEVKAEILKQLVRGENRLQIISIFGMSGLGKTTLANKLYNHPSVVDHFDKRSWCVVSQTYKKKKLLIEILSSMRHGQGENFKNMEEENLAEILYKSLKGLRYLIVIDDIWHINVWNDLEIYFPNDGIGSRILFTTRNKEVGLQASPHSVVIELPSLSPAECWELLQRKVFQDEKCSLQVLYIGKQIATSCHGLPLAVVMIAAVLANMEKRVHLWQEVARNLSSYISDNQNVFMKILALSYEHLPNHLKPCFLYFGAFEEDKEFPVRKLISLWVAEGFIKKEDQKCLEDVALEYLMQLIDRSLVLVSKQRFDGQVKMCKVHDLLHEMCLRIGEEKNLLKVSKCGYYRFFDQVSVDQQHRYPFGLHMRSLLCDDFDSSKLISSSYKVVRVLEFSRSSNYRVVIGIEHLVHLRYLAISGTLPPMKSFHKLEFLYVDNSDPVEIPDVLLTMMSLRSMDFSGGAYFSRYCRRQAAKEQSFQISNKIRSISMLIISIATDVKILRCCPNLRRAKCSLTSSLHYSLDSLNQLISLKLIMRNDSPRSISLPLNLKELILVGAKMSPEQMEIIGRLQNLEVLKLEHASFDELEWNASSEFPQLKFLKLNDVDLEEWNASSANFPSLEGLALKYCYNLKMIPSSFGDIPTLQKIEVYTCTNSVNESAEQIQEEQRDMGNEVLKVIISVK